MTTDMENPFIGEHPRPGDLVRIVRTTTRVYEGYWTDAEPREEDASGNGWLQSAEHGMRVRTEGPIEFGTGDGGSYTEADTIEVIERRNGAPFEDIIRAEREVREDDERRWREEMKRRDRPAWLRWLTGTRDA